MTDDFNLTIAKADLLIDMEKGLLEQKKKLADAKGPYQRALKAHVKHVARVLLQASKEVASGKIGPESGQWCPVRRVIEDRIGDAPSGVTELEDKIREYEAAIYQVKNARSSEILVSTSQVQRWLAGKTNHRPFRRR